MSSAAPGVRKCGQSAMLCVQEYLDKHELSRRVEEAINATVKDKPDEPLAFLVGASARE